MIHKRISANVRAYAKFDRGNIARSAYHGQIWVSDCKERTAYALLYDVVKSKFASANKKHLRQLFKLFFNLTYSDC